MQLDSPAALSIIILKHKHYMTCSVLQKFFLEEQANKYILYTEGHKKQIVISRPFIGNTQLMKKKGMYLLPINLSLENNLPTFQLNAPVVIRVKVMMTGAFSQNVGKLSSEFKLVTDNFALHLCRSQLRSH